MPDLEVRAIQDLVRRDELMLEHWKKRVSFDDPFDQSQVEIRAERQGPLVNLRAAANKESAWITGWINLVQIGDGLDSRIAELGSTQDNRLAIGQRFADRFKGFAAHDNHLSSCHLLEPLKILGQVPGDFVSPPN